MRKTRELQDVQRNIQKMSDTLLNLVNTLNSVMSNQNNLNKRLEAVEKLTEGQQTLKQVRGIAEQEDEAMGAGGTG